MGPMPSLLATGKADPAVRGFDVGSLDGGPCDSMRGFLLAGVAAVRRECVIESGTENILGMGRQVVLDAWRKIGIGSIRHDRPPESAWTKGKSAPRRLACRSTGQVFFDFRGRQVRQILDHFRDDRIPRGRLQLAAENAKGPWRSDKDDFIHDVITHRGIEFPG